MRVTIQVACLAPTFAQRSTMSAFLTMNPDASWIPFMPSASHILSDKNSRSWGRRLQKDRWKRFIVIIFLFKLEGGRLLINKIMKNSRAKITPAHNRKPYDRNSHQENFNISQWSSETSACMNILRAVNVVKWSVRSVFLYHSSKYVIQNYEADDCFHSQGA